MILDNTINTINLIALAVAPAAAIITYVLSRDKFEQEPFHLLLRSFIIGACCVLPSGLISKMLKEFFAPDDSLLGFAVFAFLIVALSEETFKYLALRYFAYPKKDFNEPFDGIVYSVMIAMGFATVENIMYIFMQDSMIDSVNVSLVRMFTAVPAHACMAILMGYYVGLAKFSMNPAFLLFSGFMVAFLFHGIYDFFLCIENYPIMTFGAILALYFSIKASFRAMSLHSASSPFRNQVSE